MKSINFRPLPLMLALLLLIPVLVIPNAAQSRPQKSESTKGDGKKNQRPTEEELKKREEERRREEEERNAIVDTEVERVKTEVVGIDAVVINKKTGAIIGGLKKGNFAIFEDGKQQTISSFSSAESPITVTLLLEFSRWTEIFGSAAGGRFEPGTYEVIRPVAYFLSRFIKPPNDYASVVAFDMRPTPITDFTNDPNRLRATIDLLLRNQPAFRENNLWDALKFTLVGGRGDTVVLENSRERYSDYSGMQDLKAPRKAIILVASGIDTFSKINYSDARKIVQEAGVPIYIISTGNLFFKKYEGYLGPTDSISGMPGRLTFLQAQNAMNTIAKESGGAHFPMTFESEVPDILQNINAELRNQYNLTYDLDSPRVPGKRYKLEVKVDVDGDGVFDDKTYVVQHRPFYVPSAPAPAKKPSK
ncbi:MAG: VWA domain-containing protein [Acidobacteria bacterium]|nr:VWA domain-containing protein [Acidobacteriota bacterium]MCW5948814.1 VWA domain-containing protein [Pyrinomonadaceae bacterium]